MNSKNPANTCCLPNLDRPFSLAAAGRSIISLAILCCILLTTAFAAPDHYLAPKEQRDKAAKIAAQYRELAGKIPSEMYEIEGLADRLDYDLDSAADYVSRQIAFDPYHGILRGPDGTLAANAGSAWDQAGLLVSLINTMGGDARVAQGALSKSEAARLLLAAFEPRAPFASPLDPQAIQDTFDDVLPANAMESAQSISTATGSRSSTDTFEQRVSRITNTVLQALKAQGVSVADSAGTDELLAALSKSYAWVEYRESPNEPWQAVHPAFGKQAAPTVTAVAYAKTEAPEEWVHYLSIELEIERHSGNAYSSEPIIAPYRGTVASFATQQTILEIGPSQAPSPGGKQADYFVPVINGNLARGAKAFTLLGMTAAAEDAAAGPAIFATVGGKLGSALGGINDASGSDDNSPRLTGVTLVITHTAPGGETRAERRRLVDFRQSIPDDPTRQLLTSAVIDVGTGRENGARDLRAVLLSNASFITRVPYVAALSQGEMQKEEVAAHPAFDRDYDQLAWQDIRTLGALLEPQPSATSVITRQSPLVVMTRLAANYDRDARMLQIVDIVHNSTLALQLNGAAAEIAPQNNVRQGVRETLAEEYLAGIGGEDTWLNSPSSQIIASVNELNDWLQENNVTAGSRDRMTADLQQSGTILMSAFEAEPRWWRINAQTGQTLGMGTYGGQAATETLAVGSVAQAVCGALTVGFFAYSAFSCESAYANNPSMLACCLTGNTLLAASGIKLGAAATSQTLGFLSASGVLQSEVAVAVILGETALNVQMTAVGLGVDPLCSAVTGN